MRRILMLLLSLWLGLSPHTVSPARGEGLSLLALNVGKADSLLLRSGGSVYLIDTGRGRTFDRVESALQSLEISHLDGVIITHMDSDHVGGLKKLLKADLQIDGIYAPAFFLPEKEGGKNPAVQAASKRNRTVTFLQEGDVLPLEGGILRVLGPLHPAKDKEDNNSLILLAETADGSMLLAGDMEFPEESDLLSAGVIPRADVLKVGNHGDDDATSEALIQAVQPQAAVISTSTAEKPSTPAPRVLLLLEKWGVQVYETQQAETGVLLTLVDGVCSVTMQ